MQDNKKTLSDTVEVNIRKKVIVSIRVDSWYCFTFKDLEWITDWEKLKCNGKKVPYFKDWNIPWNWWVEYRKWSDKLPYINVSYL